MNLKAPLRERHGRQPRATSDFEHLRSGRKGEFVDPAQDDALTELVDHAVDVRTTVELVPKLRIPLEVPVEGRLGGFKDELRANSIRRRLVRSLHVVRSFHCLHDRPVPGREEENAVRGETPAGGRCTPEQPRLHHSADTLAPVDLAGVQSGEAGRAAVAATDRGLRTDVLTLLEAVRHGTVEPAAALKRLGELPFRDLGFARVDIHRELRQGAPEAILAEGKTVAEVEAIARALLEGGAGSVLVTRADAAARAAVRRVAPDAEEDARARLAWIARGVPEACGLVTIVSGGTSDGPVVTETRVRAELLGARVVIHADAGVAGLHRLEPTLEDLNRADCVVVVAGQDAALTSVVGGLVSAPVIGVPTSTGYGATFGGLSALLSMLCSCAAGVAVVNIDDGFGAGTIAARIARAASAAQ